jgi:hypothetical protein
LFTTDEQLPARLERMRMLLHDPVRRDEAQAIRDVLYKRRPWTDMIFLACQRQDRVGRLLALRGVAGTGSRLSMGGPGGPDLRAEKSSDKSKANSGNEG